MRAVAASSAGNSLRYGVIATGAATLVGIGVGFGLGLYVLALIIAAVAFALGIVNWRWAIIGLLVYIPFSGIPIIAAYPRTQYAVLLKDILFVVPAYAGFLLARRDEPAIFPGAPLVPAIVFSGIVAAEMFNPKLPNLLVPLIGAKVWLFYIPLAILGYHFVDSEQQVRRLLSVMGFAAALPLLFGTFEAFLIRFGASATVYGWYGAAAAAVTQDFATLQVQGGGTIVRVPSTFSYGTQYYVFTVAMVAIAYAWWRLRPVPHPPRGRMAPLAIWLLAIVAAFTCGSRGAFVFVPLLVLLVIAFEARGFRFRTSHVAMIVTPLALLSTAAVVFRSTVRDLFTHALATGSGETGSAFFGGVARALHLTTVGLGAGADTNASRYAYGGTPSFQLTGGSWFESWYVKLLLELGVLGAIAGVALLIAVIACGVRQHRRLQTARMRAVSAALLAFLVWNVIYGIKGQYLDFDPANVYFWLFFGVLMKLPRLEAAQRERRSTTTAARLTTVPLPGSGRRSSLRTVPT